jgi:type VI secretion system protein ImpG
MRDELLHYYERELRFIRRELGDFAERYPAVAGQLLLEPDKCEDPHVERLIEAFSMLTARVQMRLDDDFPEITNAFLSLLQPHYLAPVPSATVVQLEADADRSDATSGMDIPRFSQLHTPAMSGVRCHFRTCYPVTLWPITVDGVDVVSLDRGDPVMPEGAVAAVRIKLKTIGAQPFSSLPLESIRFFFDGNATVAHQLYELFFRKPLGLVLRGGRKDADVSRVGSGAVYRSPDHIQPVGFAPDEGLLEYGGSGHLGHRLLQEYFCFPDKFLFADITGLDTAALASADQELEILLLLDKLPLDLEGQVSKENLKLGCAPAVNLFEHQADPLLLEHTRSEYRIVPDSHAPRGFEVHSISHVETVDPVQGKSREFRPFFGLRHGDPRDGEEAFWQSSRRPSGIKGDDGTEVFLTLIGAGGEELHEMPGDTLIVKTLCSNRDMPEQLPLGSSGGSFKIEGQPGVARIQTLRKPTSVLRLPDGRDTLWRLISLLSLNHMSLVEATTRDGEKGPVAFREMMSLLDFADTAVTRQRIAGLVGLQWRGVLRQVTVPEGRLLTRGIEVTLEFDESRFIGSGVFLFASVLERFLAHYTSLNSFTQTVATVRQRGEVLKTWAPRAGETPLV